eukprot:ANDGO_01275.mRNA.1 hypothetical protein
MEATATMPRPSSPKLIPLSKNMIRTVESQEQLEKFFSQFGGGSSPDSNKN